MTSQLRKRPIFHWATPRNLLVIFLFITLVIIVEYVVVAFAVNTGVEDAVITLPFSITISLLYHLLPLVVVITLTASFTHFTTHAATISRKPQAPRRLLSRKAYRKPTRLGPLRNACVRLRRVTLRVKNKILKNPLVAYVQNKIVLAKAIIRSAATVTATFTVVVLLITIVAYPNVISSATLNLYEWGKPFLNFVGATTEAAKAIASTIPPIGVIAGSIHSALIAASPAFHTTLEGAGSSLTRGLVALNPTEKYLIAQNAAAWIAAITALLYSQYIKTRRYRR